MTQTEDTKSSYIIYRLNNNHPDFTKDLRELVSGARELCDIAHHYDYSETVPGNGLRSFIKIIHQFVDKIFKTLNKRSDVNSDIIITAHVLNLMMKLMKLIELKRQNFNIDADEILNILSENIDDEISASVLNIPTQALASVFNMNFFWLSKSLKYHQKMYSRLIGVYETKNILNILKLVNDKQTNEKYAKFSANSTASQVYKTWGFYGIKLNKPVIALVNKLSPKIRKTLHVRRQYTWIINSNGSTITFNQNNSRISSYFDEDANVASDTNDSVASNINVSSRNVAKDGQEKVKCLFLQDASFGVTPKDSLVLHLHGGGYIALRPKCHEMYLRRWASRLNGVPIISVDYSLSPKHRFPVAIQEILDVYLFLTSGSKDVLDMIGFHPKNIILFGDSAGSNLSLCLMNILRNIDLQILNNIPSTKHAHQHIQYPKALFLPYPHMNPTLNIFNPSRLFMAIDPVLPIGPMFALTEAYNPIFKNEMLASDSLRKKSVLSTDTGYVSNISRSVSTESSSSSSSSSDSINEAKNDLDENKLGDANLLRNAKSSKEKKNKPWFRINGEKETRMEEMKFNFNNLGSFFNPLKSEYFNDFKHIPLFVQVGEYDVLLDDAISLCKKWSGPVKLDILPGMTHGFLFNRLLSSECKKATNLCNDRLLEALNL